MPPTPQLAIAAYLDGQARRIGEHLLQTPTDAQGQAATAQLIQLADYARSLQPDDPRLVEMWALAGYEDVFIAGEETSRLVEGVGNVHSVDSAGAADAFITLLARAVRDDVERMAHAGRQDEEATVDPQEARRSN